MTNEEAIKHGEEQLEIFGGEHKEFIRCALDALKREHKTEWIPVSERLPEEYASYYTTIQYKESKARDVAVLCYDTEEKEWLEIWGTGCEVVAWMPLPKPYEEGADDGRE